MPSSCALAWPSSLSSSNPPPGLMPSCAVARTVSRTSRPSSRARAVAVARPIGWERSQVVERSSTPSWRPVAGSCTGAAQHTQPCTQLEKCSAEYTVAAWSSRSARSKAFVPTLASSHRPPGTKFTCSALRRITAPPYVHRMRAAGSVTATTSSPSSAAACSWDWSCRTAAASGLAWKATRVSSASASGASCTSGRMCAADRSQLAAISVRTPARSVFADRLSQIAGMCRSQARARCERRRCNCARVAMITSGSQGYACHWSASMSHCGLAPAADAKGKGPESGPSTGSVAETGAITAL